MLREILAGILIFSCAIPAYSSSFQVSPVRIELSSSKPNTILTIRNDNNVATMIQTQLLTWSQDDGEDVLTPTDELLVNPPIFKLKPNEAQIIRLGFRKFTESPKERSYRLVVEEVPSEGLSQGLRMLLRISLPIFVKPSVPSALSLDWKVSRAKGNTIDLALVNQGNIHVQIQEITLNSSTDNQSIFSKNMATYVLPGQTYHWLVQPKAAISNPTLSLRARTDNGESVTNLKLDAP